MDLDRCQQRCQSQILIRDVQNVKGSVSPVLPFGRFNYVKAKTDFAVNSIN